MKILYTSYAIRKYNVTVPNKKKLYMMHKKYIVAFNIDMMHKRYNVVQLHQYNYTGEKKLNTSVNVWSNTMSADSYRPVYTKWLVLKLD